MGRERDRDRKIEITRERDFGRRVSKHPLLKHLEAHHFSNEIKTTFAFTVRILNYFKVFN